MCERREPVPGYGLSSIIIQLFDAEHVVELFYGVGLRFGSSSASILMKLGI